MRWWPLSKKQQSRRQPAFMEGQDGYVFRRSRTLTGTTSSKVAVSAENRGQLKTQRLKLHELRQYRIQALKGFGVVVAVVGVVVYIASIYVYSPSINAVQAGKSPAIDAYQQSVQAYLSSRPLERLGIILNATELEDYLKKQHTELKSVTVDREWYGGNLQLALRFREPLLTWTADGQKYYVDSEGYAFGYNNFTEPEVAVIDQSGISPDVGGGAVASGRFVSFLGRMVGALNAYGKGKVESVTLPASTRQIDLKLKGRGTLIKTHIDRDPAQQAEDIANTLAYFDSKELRPDYIDVRVAGRAFYR